MAMSWAQVRGLNYSTMGRTIGAVVHYSGRGSQRVRHAGPERWRMDDEAGNPILIENAADVYRRADDGVMLHSSKSPLELRAGMNSPATLFTAYQSWPPVTAGSMLPQRFVDPSDPVPVQVRGRAGWEVSFREQHSSDRTSYVIDAELGIALSWQLAGQWMELSDPVLDEHYSHSIFTWDGPVREQQAEPASQAQLEHERKQRVIAEIPRALPTWLPLSIDSHPQDGDPRTGALDLTVYGQQVFLTLRRWVTAIGEPDVDFPVSLSAVRHRQVVGEWSYEILSDAVFDAADYARIIDSIVPVAVPERAPSEIVDELEAERANQREAEVVEMLGIGRTLDEFRGGNVSLLIRTDFSDDTEWRNIVIAAQADDENDFAANLTCIDNREYDGITIDRLLELTADHEMSYVFAVDATTVADPQNPVLVIKTRSYDPERSPGRTFRTVPSEMASIENNLSLANMDFEDFADNADADGVFRGFPSAVAQLTSAQLVEKAAVATDNATLTRFVAYINELSYPYPFDLYEREASIVRLDAERLAGSEGATLDGYDDYVAVVARNDVLATCIVPVTEGGWWSIVFDPADLSLLAAMRFIPPAVNQLEM